MITRVDDIAERGGTRILLPVLFASKKTPTPRPPTPIKGEGEKSSMITRVDDIAERGGTRILLPEPRHCRAGVYSLEFIGVPQAHSKA